MRLSRKLMVLSTFACRIFVVAATISRLVYLNRLKHSPDLFFDSIPYNICTQVQQAISVIAASTPGLRKFLEHSNTGMLNVSLAAHTDIAYGETHWKDTHPLTNISKKDMKTPASEERNGTVPIAAPLFRPEGVMSKVMITGGHHRDSLGNGLDDVAGEEHPNGPNYPNSRTGSEDEIEREAESLGSHHSEKMFIAVRKDWEVTRL